MAAEPRASFYGEAIPELARATAKPVIVAWTGALSVAERGFPMLAAAEVPTFLSVREAVQAMEALVRWRAFLDRHAAS
jgi:acyl-CoA synthetase (NDP forming)